MREADIMSLIQGGENSTVEFKRDGISPERVAREIVALANLKGGTILLGVEDDGGISGTSRENLSEWIFDTVIGRYVHPLILPYYEEIRIEGKQIAVLNIPQGDSKPYVVRHKDREEVYIRLGRVTKLAGREQQARLYASGGMLHTEILPVSGTSARNLDRARVENYLRDIIADPQVPEREGEWLDRMKGLGFLTADGSGATVCTVAGLVLFGIRPRLALRQAGIRLMVFRGLDKEYQALHDVVLDGPMVGRWQVNGTQRTLIDSGLIEKLIDSITPFVSEEASEIDEYFRREKRWFYPIDAVRETVVNALAHRDWTRTVDIEVGIYADRMEVTSPGALPNSMSIEKVLAGQRAARNQIIVDVLRDYGYVDARGMGVRTKVVPQMRAIGSEPAFVASEDYFRTLLHRPDLENSPSGRQIREEGGIYRVRKNRYKGSFYEVKGSFFEKGALPETLLDYLSEHPGSTYEVIAKALGTSPATVKRKIQALKKEGRLRRIGSKKTGYWLVV